MTETVNQSETKQPPHGRKAIMSTKGRAKKASPSRNIATKPSPTPTPPDMVEEVQSEDTNTADISEEIQKAVDVLTETFGRLTPVTTETRNFKTLKALDNALDKAFAVGDDVSVVFALNGMNVMTITSAREGALDVVVSSDDPALNESVARLVWQFELDDNESEPIDPDYVSDWSKPWSVIILAEVYGDDEG